MSIAKRLRGALPLFVMAPSLTLIGVGVYGFIAITFVLSLTSSRMFPKFDFVGFDQYVRLFSNDRWHIAVHNMVIFGGLYMVLGTLLGLMLAILIDQRIRAEGFFRTVYLYPMALSFVVTGVIWQWMLNPSLGIEKLLHDWGFVEAKFRWLVDPEWAIYTVVIAGVWQVTGFVMAIFLAGLRGVDTEILKAARVDGASPWKTYTRIIIPALRPAFMTVLVVEGNLAIKSYDLVIALTKGGPGISTELPSTFMYSTTFNRNDLALGASSAVIMLMTVAAIVIPYLYMELKDDKR
ncbi:MAG: carbohydrate ABC transporter permease [Thiolinea sp.]